MNSDTGSPSALTSVGQWLSKLNLAEYESLFINYGFDDLEFIVSMLCNTRAQNKERYTVNLKRVAENTVAYRFRLFQNGVLEESDLKEMGITSEHDRAAIVDAVTLLNNRVEKRPGANSASQTVDDWLKSIHLDSYTDLFRRHLYTDMDRVRRVWEVELAAVLEIQKPAHRKRILASVNGAQPRNNSHVRNGNGPTLEDLNKDFNTLVSHRARLFYILFRFIISFVIPSSRDNR